MRITFILSILLFFTSIADLKSQDPLLELLRDEMHKAKDAFSKLEQPPYYFEIGVLDNYTCNVTLESGALTISDTNRSLLLKGDVRVGDYDFDNTHTMGNDFWGMGYGMGQSVKTLPIDRHELGMQYKIYELLNGKYRSNLEEYKNKQEQLKLSTMEIKPSKDLTRETADKYYENPLSDKVYTVDLDAWHKRLSGYHRILEPHLEDHTFHITLQFYVNREYFLNSEGTEVVENHSEAQLSIIGITMSDEGEIILFQYVKHAFTPGRLPSDEKILQDLKAEIKTITALKSSKKAEPFVGPAILSPEATGVFFHEIFGHRIEGHRLAYQYDSKTFSQKIGDPVLPKFLSVTFDPTQVFYNEVDLIGHYKFDSQGVRGQRVECIQKGVLNDYLMSRKPVKGFDQSNGHGRGEFGSAAVSRQSNMFVETSKAHSDEELRKMLKKECKKQDLEYGYYFKKVSGGFTNTMNYMPDFFSIIPIEVYKVYADGRPDELVHGVNLIGTPLVMFSEIIAAGEETAVFNGICGAESGGVPVSAIAPAILVKKIETQSQSPIDFDKPILQSPRLK